MALPNHRCTLVIALRNFLPAIALLGEFVVITIVRTVQVVNVIAGQLGQTHIGVRRISRRKQSLHLLYLVDFDTVVGQCIEEVVT